jgi:ABC-type Fe3+/spermidine/putrescine transport system ATPase subunit
MRSELHILLKRIGVTAVYVTHDQEEAFVISDRIILMKDGKIVQEARPKELYEEPKCTFAAEFIGRANILKAKVKSIDEKKKTARIEVPEIGAELTCKYDCDVFPKDATQMLVRYNEIAMCESKPNCIENVLEGEVISRDYRGSVTDHKVNVGKAQLIVTTHRFCTMSSSTEKKNVFLYVPPEAIKPVEEK